MDSSAADEEAAAALVAATTSTSTTERGDAGEGAEAAMAMAVVAPADIENIEDNAAAPSRRKSQLTAQTIMQKGKYGAALFITNELARREKLQQLRYAAAAKSQQTAVNATTAKKYRGQLSDLLLAPARPPVPPTAAAALPATTTTDHGLGPSDESAATQQHHHHHHHLDNDDHDQDIVIDEEILLPDLEDYATATNAALCGVDDGEEEEEEEGADNEDTVKGTANGYRLLKLLLDDLLAPDKPIDDLETIDWCKWLIAGGRMPDDFAGIGKSDNPIYKCKFKFSLFT